MKQSETGQMQPPVLPSSEQNLGEMCVDLLSGGSGTGHIFWLRPYKTSPGYCGTHFSDSLCVCAWCVHVYERVYMVCACVRVWCMCVHVYVVCVYMCIWICECVMYMCVGVCTCMYMHMCVCASICVCMCVWCVQAVFGGTYSHTWLFTWAVGNQGSCVCAAGTLLIK